MKSILWISCSSGEQLREALSFASPLDNNYLMLTDESNPDLPKDAAALIIDRLCYKRFPSNIQKIPAFFRKPINSVFNRIYRPNCELFRKIRTLKIDRYILVQSWAFDISDIEHFIKNCARYGNTEIITFLAKKWSREKNSYEDEPWFWHTKLPDWYNFQGFRGVSCLTSKTGNEFRIFCFGGSTTYGSGSKKRNLQIEDNETYPYFLEQAAKERFSGSGRDVSVFNLGMTGASSGVMRSRLQEFLKFIPDLVIIHSGYNDLPLITDVQEDRYTYIKPDLSVPENFQWLVDFYRNNKKKSFLSNRKRFSQSDNIIKEDIFLGFNISQEKGRFSGDENEVEQEFWRRFDVYKDNILEIIRHCLENNIKVVFALQPRIIPNHWVCRTSFREPKSAEIQKRFHNMQRTEIRKYLLEFHGHEDFCIIDLAEIFNGRERSYYIDEAHLGAEGNKMVAQALLSPVESLLSSADPVMNSNICSKGKSDQRKMSIVMRMIIIITGFCGLFAGRKKTQGTAGKDENVSPFNYPLH